MKILLQNKLASLGATLIAFGSLAGGANAATLVLDFDSASTGLNLDSSPLVSTLGTITFSNGEITGTGDSDLVAAGSTGNVADITIGQDAILTFDFDVESVSFIYGGNAGIFNLEVRDISNNILDSINVTTEDGASAGPVTLSGGATAIRSIAWRDPGNNFAPIDNLTITAPESVSPVPEPSSTLVLGAILAGGLLQRRRR